MSLDITIWAERLTERGWEAVVEPKRPGWRPRLMEFYPQNQRNRFLFQLLGARWHEDRKHPVLCPPRGLPKDSLFLAEMPEEKKELFLAGDQSTWFTVQELLDVPWHTKRCRAEGYVNGEEFEYWLVFGADYTLGDSYDAVRAAEYQFRGAGDMAVPPDHLIVTHSEMERALDAGQDALNLWTKIDCKEQKTYAYFCREFCDVTLPMLADLGDPEAMRLVMVFD